MVFSLLSLIGERTCDLTFEIVVQFECVLKEDRRPGDSEDLSGDLVYLFKL
jgi:hypothetical protein